MAKKAKTTTAEAVTTVYIGRPLPGLAQYTVFRGGELPPHVERLIAENPAIKQLIVPASSLQEARRNIRTKGHVLNHFAGKI